MPLIDKDGVVKLYPDLDATRVTNWLPKVIGRAITVAPCLRTPDKLDEHVLEAVNGILAGAVRRLAGDTDASGTTGYQVAGPFSHQQDSKRVSDRLLTLADRDELRQLCRGARQRRRGGTIRTPIGY